MTHRSIFSTGGFVLHKLPLGKARRTSAWYDDEGKLLSCTVYSTYSTGGGRKAVVDGPIWQEAQRYGRIYKPTAAELVARRAFSAPQEAV